MNTKVAPELIAHQQEVISQIYKAFEGVSREGGVSWSEQRAIDSHEMRIDRASARAADKDVSWTELVDDPNWCTQPGFSFLDPIGFRYYLPAAMVRDARGCDGNAYNALYDQTWRASEEASLLTLEQRRAVVSFIRFMALLERTRSSEFSEWEWLQLLERWERLYHVP